MGRDVPVSQGIARRQELSAFAQIDTVIREWFVACAAVDNLSTDEVFRFAGANWWSKSLNLTDSMWVLPETPLSERTKVVECTFLIEVALEHKFIRSVMKISLSVHKLLSMWLHWWNWTTLGFQMGSAESWIFGVSAWSHCFCEAIVDLSVRLSIGFGCSRKWWLQFTTKGTHQKLSLKRLMALPLFS